MTSIAFDGKTLASDSQVTSGGTRAGTLQKVYHLKKSRVGECLVGFAGEASKLIGFLQYLEKLRKEPPSGTYDAVVIVKENSTIRGYDDGEEYVLLTAPVAIGSGGDFALAALHMGYSAVEAVRLAIKLDIYSGGDIQSVSFGDTE